MVIHWPPGLPEHSLDRSYDILRDLEARLQKGDVNHAESVDLLKELWALTKDEQSSAFPLANDELTATTLSQYAFGDFPRDVVYTALRALDNVLEFNPSTRQNFVKHGYPSKALALSKDDDNEIKALAKSILGRLEGTAVDRA